MSTLYVRNVPDDLIHELKVAAVKNRRTCGEEIILRLAKSFPHIQEFHSREYQPTTIKETAP